MSHRYFTFEELKCKCCGKSGMNADFMYKMDKARGISGVPYVPNSAFRCEDHNKEVGGSDTSSHLLGLAMDIATPDSPTRYKILTGLIKAGFTRLGISKDFVHVDDDPLKPPSLVWVY